MDPVTGPPPVCGRTLSGGAFLWGGGGGWSVYICGRCNRKLSEFRSEPFLGRKKCLEFGNKKALLSTKNAKSFFFLCMTLVKSLYTALIKSRNKASSAAEFVAAGLAQCVSHRLHPVHLGGLQPAWPWFQHSLVYLVPKMH